MYKYETHVHSYPASACGVAQPEEVAECYFEAGYSGMVLTDHFFNGNTGIDRSLEWKERLDKFCDGYIRAKKRGDELGIKVFFGFEYNWQGAEFLVYNCDPRWLYDRPTLLGWDISEFLSEVRRSGAFVIHCHPYRNASYINDPGKRFGNYIDAVEVYNACNAPSDNFPAEQYASDCGLIRFAGSDNHNPRHLQGSGILLPEYADTIEQLIAQVRAGEHELMIP